MNLWPFSKKTNSSPLTPQQVEKMELPPGVILASPDEPDTLTAAPLVQAGLVGSGRSASAPESMVQPDTVSPPVPSLADLALLPVEESPPAGDDPVTGSPSSPPHSPKDLPDFFEKHQLEMIATGSAHSGLPSQNSGAIEAVPSPPSPEMPLESMSLAPGFDSLSPPQGTDLPPVNANTHAFLSEPEMTGTQNLSPDFEENPVSLDAQFNDFAFLSPEALEDPLSLFSETSAPVADPVDDPAAGIYPPTGISAPKMPVTPSLPEDLFAFDSFLQPSGADDALMNAVNRYPNSVQAPSLPEAEGWGDESWTDNSANHLVQHSEAFFLYPAQESQPAGQADNHPLSASAFNPWQASSELSPVDHWMAQAPDEVPLRFGQDDSLLPSAPDSAPPDAIPEEALTSAMDDLQLGPDTLGNPESPALFFDSPSGVLGQPLSDGLSLPLPEGLDLDDEAFDLDSILLGTADSEEVPGQSVLPPETPTSELSPSVSLADSVEPSDADILEHYFGDEAQGLKGHDNLDSYDFGHYEDPDAPAEAFVLGEAPQPASSFLSNLSYDQYYTEPESELSFSANLLSPQDENSDDLGSPEAPTPNGLPDNSYAAFSLESENADETAGPEGWPQSDLELDTFMGPIDLDDPEPATAYASPEPPPTAESQPEPAKPLPEKLVPENFAELALLLESKMTSEPADQTAPPQSESISDVINTFSQDVLLHNNRFLGRSIDRLAEAYFARQNQNNA